MGLWGDEGVYGVMGGCGVMGGALGGQWGFGGVCGVLGGGVSIWGGCGVMGGALGGSVGFWGAVRQVKAKEKARYPRLVKTSILGLFPAAVRTLCSGAGGCRQRQRRTGGVHGTRPRSSPLSCSWCREEP